MTIYDEHEHLYVEFVDRALAAEPSLFKILLDVLDDLLSDRVAEARILDVACGEGYVSRHFAAAGAREVVGIDVSAALIAEAERRTDGSAVRYAVDDAQQLATLVDGSFDVVVSQMAMMDIADHRAVFDSVRRVLKPDGAFAFTLLHPCFEGPYRLPDEPQFLDDAAGERIAVAVRHYASEGHWQSEGAGIRGHVGSHHRMLSTYLNGLIDAGFRIERIAEPVAPPGHGLASEVPRVLAVSATATGSASRRSRT